MTTTLTSIGLKYGTDKSYWHRYTDYYEKFFLPYKDKHINILEIGVFQGSSLKMLEEFFPNANIYGIDILDKSQYNSNRIKCLIGDQNNPETITTHFRNIKFDIILDDGSHDSFHQIICLKFLWEYLNHGGIYIIEDLQTSYNIDNNSSAFYTMNKWFKKGEIDSLHLKEMDYQKIKGETKYIDLWIRDYYPLRCWKCKKDNFSKPFCDCGENLLGSGSITSVVQKI